VKGETATEEDEGGRWMCY